MELKPILEQLKTLVMRNTSTDNCSRGFIKALQSGRACLAKILYAQLPTGEKCRIDLGHDGTLVIKFFSLEEN